MDISKPETPAQFTRRLMEEYKDVLERMDRYGMTEDEILFDKLLVKIYNLKNNDYKKLEKLSDIMKKY